MKDATGMKITIEGGKGKAIALAAGDAVRLVNTPGTQVVDTWAVIMDDPTEMMSTVGSFWCRSIGFVRSSTTMKASPRCFHQA